MNTLVIDVGVTHIQMLATGHATRHQLPSRSTLTAGQMVKAVKALTADWPYDQITIGYPGPVVRGRIAAEPTYEHYVGLRGLERCGKKKCRRHVFDVVARLKEAVQAEDLVLGGGNVKCPDRLPEGARFGNNMNAFKGGYRRWPEPPPPTS
jgi:hypothetical protein